MILIMIDRVRSRVFLWKHLLLKGGSIGHRTLTLLRPRTVFWCTCAARCTVESGE